MQKNKSLLYKLGRGMLKHRVVILSAIVVFTIFFGYWASTVSFKNPTTDLFPKNHPYVETYVQYEDIFGGANIVIIALEKKNGDIFNTETLTKIKKITKALEFLPAVNNYQVLSIAQRKIKKTRVKDVEGYQSDPIMWPDIPQTEEEIADLRRSIYTTGRLHGALVSLDDKSALIVAGFFEKGLVSPGAPLREVVTAMAIANKQDPAAALEAMEKVASDAVWTLDNTLYEAMDTIVTSQRDDNTNTYMIGIPALYGQIYKRMPKLITIFILTILSIIAVLSIYFRDIRGVTIPVITALISAVWGVGILGLLGYDFNPLVIVVPFIISARALSHSVQLIERYLEEYEATGDREEASVLTFSGLFKPGMLSIITDAAGVFIVILTPIPLMEKLAIMGSFWVLSIIVSDVIFNPIFLSFFPPPKTRKSETPGRLDRFLETVGHWTYGKQRTPILIITVLVFIIGAFFAKNLVIGDVHPGTPLLWPGDRYNLDTDAIGKTFGNTETMSVIVEGKSKNAIKNPIVLRNMEGLQRHLEQLDQVTTTGSISDLVPAITKIMHGGNPKWELIPKEEQESGFYLGMIFSGAEPGDLARYITNDFKDANITVNLKDHRGETLRSVVAAAKDYIASHPMENIENTTANFIPEAMAVIENSMDEKDRKALRVFLMDYFAANSMDVPGMESEKYINELVRSVEKDVAGSKVKSDFTGELKKTANANKGQISQIIISNYIRDFRKTLKSKIDKEDTAKVAIDALEKYVSSNPLEKPGIHAGNYLHEFGLMLDHKIESSQDDFSELISPLLKEYTETGESKDKGDIFEQSLPMMAVFWQTPGLEDLDKFKSELLRYIKTKVPANPDDEFLKAFEGKVENLGADMHKTYTDARPKMLLKKYLVENRLQNARFRMAGNYGGLLAAVNEAIVKAELKVTLTAFFLVFLFCSLAYKSGWAGVFFLIPILLSNYMTFALMGALNIGLDVNALPVVSLGVGLGVDYGLYVLGRVEEEYAINPDINAATVKAISTAGRAVLFTASTMVAGIIFWAFSYLRFQAEMGILLAFWMIVSMLGGLVLLPSLVTLFKPRFITKGK